MKFTYFLSLVLFIFSSCSTTTKIYTTEESTEKKIQYNQSQALSAQDEYKRLQAKRQKE